MAGCAIGVAQASNPDSATRATIGAAAIDSRLAAVLPVVGALTRNALERDSVAGVAGAIGIRCANQADSASPAYPASAIYVCLKSVLSVVDALIRNTREGISVAGVVGAIGVDIPASFSECARRASTAAAIDVCFCAVLTLVDAQACDTLTGDEIADACCAVEVGRASLSNHADANSSGTGLARWTGYATSSAIDWVVLGESTRRSALHGSGITRRNLIAGAGAIALIGGASGSAA